MKTLNTVLDENIEHSKLIHTVLETISNTTLDTNAITPELETSIRNIADHGCFGDINKLINYEQTSQFYNINRLEIYKFLNHFLDINSGWDHNTIADFISSTNYFNDCTPLQVEWLLIKYSCPFEYDIKHEDIGRREVFKNSMVWIIIELICELFMTADD